MASEWRLGLIWRLHAREAATATSLPPTCLPLRFIDVGDGDDDDGDDGDGDVVGPSQMETRSKVQQLALP